MRYLKQALFADWGIYSPWAVYLTTVSIFITKPLEGEATRTALMRSARSMGFLNRFLWRCAPTLFKPTRSHRSPPRSDLEREYPMRYRRGSRRLDPHHCDHDRFRRAWRWGHAAGNGQSAAQAGGFWGRICRRWWEREKSFGDVEFGILVLVGLLRG
jgi:hypothetical protein